MSRDVTGMSYKSADMVVCDFDGTMINGNIGKDFFRWLRKREGHPSFRKRLASKFKYPRSSPDIDCYMPSEFLSYMTQYCAETDLRYPINKQLVSLLDGGDKCVLIVTGSPEVLVREFCSRHLASLRVRIVGLTYGSDVTRPYGRTKVTSLMESGVESDYHAYGNSIGDLAMLRKSLGGVLFNPSRLLRIYIHLCGRSLAHITVQKWSQC